ncbi:hypothetical protein ACHQM5_027269 [Ranunculus cassubicifolius]
MCSTINKEITPVSVCIMIFTTTVTTNILMATVFAKLSNSLLPPRDGMRSPIDMHIKVVPLSFDNWS